MQSNPFRKYKLDDKIFTKIQFIQSNLDNMVYISDSRDESESNNGSVNILHA